MPHRKKKDQVFARSEGKCQLCGRKIAETRYGDRSSPYGWEIDHIKALSKDGHPTHLNNLQAACWSCNVKKSNSANSEALRDNGRSRPPLSKKKESAARTKQTYAGGLVGGGGLGIAALVLGAPVLPLVAVGAVVGATIGYSSKPADPGLLPKGPCQAPTKEGRSCRNHALPGARYCGVHEK